MIARVHGHADDKVSVYLPDGQLGFASGLSFVDEPFRVATFDEMRQQLAQGPFANFRVIKTAHYLVLYQSSEKFAEASGQLLEHLYKGLVDAFRKKNVPIHEAEFPLVAIIFRTEADFRAFKPVAQDVLAYYEIMTNRIYFFQNSQRDEAAPEVAALRRPQTVAHEGTHQILSNIGIQPRLGSWPPWLIEGLAEYCSPPTQNRKGDVNWNGLGVVNPMHMATIRDLDDQATLQMGESPLVGRDPKQPLVEYLITKSELTPTDYALSWAMTHYLAMKRPDDFVAYLAKMSKMAPLQERTSAQHLADFRAAFGSDLVKLDKAIGVHLAKLKGYKELPYYAVIFEQPLVGNRLKRAVMISQSPLLIREWIDTISNPEGAAPQWQALPHPSRTRAIFTAEQWLRNR